jgi:anti-sigma B factor antagonist
MTDIESQIAFQIETSTEGAHEYVLSPSGELDLYTAPELKSELLRVAAEGATRVVVDLGATTFVDSTTLGVLLGAAKRLRMNGGDLVLVCADRNIRRILEITLLDRVFTIYERRADALEGSSADG